MLERIEVEGNHRTAREKVIETAGLREGGSATPAELQSAAERLRAAHLFREVDVHTRPGSGPGHVAVVFRVEENRPHLRLGLGYQDLSGWYLIPLQLNLDNLSGHGERLDLSTRFGYRVQGLALTWRRACLDDPRDFAEIALRGEGSDRIYFLDQAEIVQKIEQAGCDLRAGRALTERLALAGWATYERLDPDSSGEVHHSRETQGLEQGDELPFALLPAEIQAGVAERDQARLGLALVVDSRRGEALRTRGFWGRTFGEVVFSKPGDFRSWQWDLRGYLPLTEAVALAGRSRAGIVSANAPFFERFYLGGLYTVRGHPDHALSPPEGNSRFAALSAELRARWIGPADDPRLTGILFLDYGIGWDDGTVALGDGASAMGFGVRLRLPWIGRLGLDVGRPLSPSPVDEAFHINGCIGWTF
ncbi:MAG: BamA/TamA family outer membrane protein [Candidatus Eisenbacteria bacterium]